MAREISKPSLEGSETKSDIPVSGAGIPPEIPIGESLEPERGKRKRRRRRSGSGVGGQQNPAAEDGPIAEPELKEKNKPLEPLEVLHVLGLDENSSPEEIEEAVGNFSTDNRDEGKIIEQFLELHDQNIPENIKKLEEAVRASEAAKASKIFMESFFSLKNKSGEKASAEERPSTRRSRKRTRKPEKPKIVDQQKPAIEPEEKLVDATAEKEQTEKKELKRPIGVSLSEKLDDFSENSKEAFSELTQKLEGEKVYHFTKDKKGNLVRQYVTLNGIQKIGDTWQATLIFYNNEGEEIRRKENYNIGKTRYKEWKKELPKENDGSVFLRGNNGKYGRGTIEERPAKDGKVEYVLKNKKGEVVKTLSPEQVIRYEENGTVAYAERAVRRSKLSKEGTINLPKPPGEAKTELEIGTEPNIAKENLEEAGTTIPELEPDLEGEREKLKKAFSETEDAKLPETPKHGSENLDDWVKNKEGVWEFAPKEEPKKEKGFFRRTWDKVRGLPKALYQEVREDVFGVGEGETVGDKFEEAAQDIGEAKSKKFWADAGRNAWAHTRENWSWNPLNWFKQPTYRYLEKPEKENSSDEEKPVTKEDSTTPKS